MAWESDVQMGLIDEKPEVKILWHYPFLCYINLKETKVSNLWMFGVLRDTSLDKPVLYIKKPLKSKK